MPVNMTRVEVSPDKDDHEDIPTEAPTVFSVDDKDWDAVQAFLEATSIANASSAGVKDGGALGDAGADPVHDGAIEPMWTSSARSAAAKEVFGTVEVVSRGIDKRSIRKVHRNG